MMTKLERKWWFSVPVLALAAILTDLTMQRSGIGRPGNAAQYVLYFFCFVGLQRGLSFLGWLLVLLLSPADLAIERTR